MEVPLLFHSGNGFSILATATVKPDGGVDALIARLLSSKNPGHRKIVPIRRLFEVRIGAIVESGIQ
jgi:hypothetical protein